MFKIQSCSTKLYCSKGMGWTNVFVWISFENKVCFFCLVLDIGKQCKENKITFIKKAKVKRVISRCGQYRPLAVSFGNFIKKQISLRLVYTGNINVQSKLYQTHNRRLIDLKTTPRVHGKLGSSLWSCKVLKNIESKDKSTMESILY